MEVLTGFAVLSLVSMLMLSLLPDTKLKSTVRLVSSLLLLLSWLTALQTLFLRFSQPESAETAVFPLSETVGFSLSDAQSDAEDALSHRISAQEEAP